MNHIILADIEKVGPGIWFKIHSDAIAAKTQQLKESFIININALCDGFKCKHCQPHFRKFINENPIQNYFNIKDKKGRDIGIFQWTWEFHNAVNIRLDKYQPLLEEAYDFYNNNNIGICYKCGQNNVNNVNNIHSINNNSINNNSINNIPINNNSVNNIPINNGHNINRIPVNNVPNKSRNVSQPIIVQNEETQSSFKPYSFQNETNKNKFPFKSYQPNQFKK